MFDIANIATLKEGNQLEAKSAQGGLPQSIWETYSAFANTFGGTILLGVSELRSQEFKVTGVSNPERIVKVLWDTLNNPSKVSANILSSGDIAIKQAKGLNYIVIEVPRADFHLKPIYIGGNPMTGTYRRNGEGDYHCSKREIRAMFRDSNDEDGDRTTLSTIDYAALCTETVGHYRNTLNSVRPDHPWIKLSDEEFLLRLGAVARSAADGLLHPTRAGLLMFGYEYQITAEYPNYFLDYRESFSDERWDDRIVTCSGDWSGNVFDFWLRVSPKLTANLKRPFALDGMYRVDNTPLHGALREALANMLFHADYYGETNSTVVKSESRVTFSNPGTMLVPLDVAEMGGISSTRNSTLMKMFNLVAVGEKAGSGFDGMRQGCAWAGISAPVVHERMNPDRVELTFDIQPLASADSVLANTAQPDKTQVKAEQSGKGSSCETLPKKSGAAQRDKEVKNLQDALAALLEASASIKRSEVEMALGVSKSTATKLVDSLVQEGRLEKQGVGRATYYVVVR